MWGNRSNKMFCFLNQAALNFSSMFRFVLDQWSSSRTMHQIHVEGLLKPRWLSLPTSFWFSRSMVGPNMCVSCQFPCDVDAAHLGLHLENHSSRWISALSSGWVFMSPRSSREVGWGCPGGVPVTRFSSSRDGLNSRRGGYGWTQDSSSYVGKTAGSASLGRCPKQLLGRLLELSLSALDFKSRFAGLARNLRAN